MGVATGGMGVHVPPGLKFQGDIPPEIAFFEENWLNICQNFQIFQYFQNKVAKIRGEIRIKG